MYFGRNKCGHSKTRKIETVGLHNNAFSWFTGLGVFVSFTGLI
jgi:hypothetical protein